MLTQTSLFQKRVTIIVITFLCLSQWGTANFIWAVENPVLKSIYEEQNTLAMTVVLSLDPVLQEFYDLAAMVETLSTLDEETGQHVLTFLEASLIPQLTTTTELVGDMLANAEAASLLETTTGTKTSRPSKQILEPLVSAIVILAVAGGGLYITAKRIVGRTRAVSRQVDQARAEGRSQAEAFGAASPQFKKALGDSIRDTQDFISSNALTSPAAAEPLRPCGQAVVTVIADRGQTIREASRVIGRRKLPPTDAPKQATSQQTLEELQPIYLGESDSGTFENIPLGDWDFIVFSDNRVPTAINDVAINSCDVPQPVTVTMPPIEEEVVGPAWRLARVVPNPNNGPLNNETPRISSSCTLSGETLSIDHRRQSGNMTTVDVTFTYAFEPLPQVVGVGDVIEVPITLMVTGEHINENAGATAGFLGFRDSLSVAACSLTACGGNPDAMLNQAGVARVLFSGMPSDPTRTFEVTSFLNDTTVIGSHCRIQHIYEFVPDN